MQLHLAHSQEVFEVDESLRHMLGFLSNFDVAESALELDYNEIYFYFPIFRLDVQNVREALQLGKEPMHTFNSRLTVAMNLVNVAPADPHRSEYRKLHSL